jgi:hypothetical protein
VQAPAGRSVSTAQEYDVGKQTVRVDGVAGGGLRQFTLEDRTELGACGGRRVGAWGFEDNNFFASG